MSNIQNQQAITISNSSNVTMGNIENVVHADLSTREDELAKAFILLREQVNALPQGPNKRDAQSALQALEAEAKKHDQAEATTVSRWLRFLLEAAPDIAQVAIDTFLNPIQGLSTVFKKVAERAKTEREATEKRSEKQ